MRELADDRSCDPSNVTGLVDRAERLGLVERTPSPDDRRIRLLTITSRGRKVRARVNRELAAELSDVLGLDEEGIEQVTRLLSVVNPQERSCGP